MFTMVLPQRHNLTRVGACRKAGKRILEHMLEELDYIDSELKCCAMDDFPAVFELRLNRRELRQRMEKMERLTKTAGDLAMKAMEAGGLITLTPDERWFMAAWMRQATHLPDRDLAAATAWMLEQLADPHM